MTSFASTTNEVATQLHNNNEILVKSNRACMFSSKEQHSESLNWKSCGLSANRPIKCARPAITRLQQNLAHKQTVASPGSKVMASGHGARERQDSWVGQCSHWQPHLDRSSLWPRASDRPLYIQWKQHENESHLSHRFPSWSLPEWTSTSNHRDLSHGSGVNLACGIFDCWPVIC